MWGAMSDPEKADIVGALRSLDASLSTVEDYQATSGVLLKSIDKKLDTILEFLSRHEERQGWCEKTDERLARIERTLPTIQ